MTNQYSNIQFNDEYIRKLFIANVEKIRIEARHLLLPPPDQSVSEWADANRYLPDYSVMPGRWKTSNMPHLRGIMDAANSPNVREITIMKSAQSGGTEAVMNIVGERIDHRPCSIMYMLPTDSDVMDLVKLKFDPMINASQSLRKKVKDLKKEASTEKESTRKKRFPGGWIRFFSGSSTAGTRQRSGELTIDDDTDQLVIGQQREGDPVERLKARTKTYKRLGRGLNIHVSTPTRVNESRISALYDISNMQKYYVTCPHCNELFYFKPERLVWKKDYEENLFEQNIPDEKKKVLKHYPETASYACDNCGGEIDERTRQELLDSGIWIAERPEIKDHYGFWFNDLCSKMSTMAELAKKIVDAGDNPEKLEALYNLNFGLPYDAGIGEESADADELYDRCKREQPYINPNKPFEVPNEIFYAVQTVDVQKDRLETMVVGVGADTELWVLLYQVIPKNPLVDKSAWRDIDKIYFAPWIRKDGVKIPVLRQFVDSGYQHHLVYSHTRGRERRGIWAIKGKGGYGVPPLPRSFQWVDNNRTKLLHLGSNAAKLELYARLKLSSPGPKYIHYPECYCNEDFFKQFSNERLVRKYTGMISYYVYEKPDRHTANEVVDLMYYAICAVQHINTSPDAVLKKNLQKQAAKLQEEREQNPEPETHNQEPKNLTSTKKIKRRLTARRI